MNGLDDDLCLELEVVQGHVNHQSHLPLDISETVRELGLVPITTNRK